MGKVLKIAAASVGILGVAAIGAFWALGPAKVWRVAGDPDQGSVDWDHLERSGTPNDSFVGSVGACATPADITLSAYNEPPDALIGRVDAVIRSGILSGDVQRVDDGQDRLARRYVVRTPTMGFPDTLNVAVRAIDGQSGLLLYSRSLLGRSDLGANEKRLMRIVEALRDKAIASD
ncbi:DUF1499 domain-containing protein [Fulvimarina sp. 2208YS6-2-32]|uniref:DUF1499 domain-containing protein n=1 Tax=Fulvimarina uroteuthidis TaxID=3098149 RepID=A0ABU5HWR3_9HYPH|nr:DUF1499 domain-containing protein [Fulvimarina sp. 2208YS6-2-32]MDY8107581.1 DUF1499 domain-containing protein [Fulvimarina sp. 2208YS6-2-32]